ncbi:MAG TPA: hypothetical protein VFK29_02155 [Rhodanobacteraceae bacterium]|jgi:hypothetical protein|nr:hypothetical protein [Rhodanobacteraceae bacterium]
MIVPPRGYRWLRLALWAGLALPPVRHALEATMTLQMLVQIPLLAVAGWWLAPLLARRLLEPLAAWNCNGISGILLASFAAAVWMLPRMLDAALQNPWVALAKFTSVPLLVGLPLALSWPRAGFVVRGLWLAEAIAMMFRVGWLYMASPVRLCSNYLLDDQRQLGRAMLAIGAAICLVLAWKLLWGQGGRAGARQR